MEKITTLSTSLYSERVIEPIVLEEKSLTRKIFIADINDKKLKSGETVSGTIIHQRKNQSNEWEAIESINLATLKGGEGIKLKLNSAQTKRLYDGLTKLYTLSKKGVHFGEQKYVVGRSDEILTVPAHRRGYIQKLIEENHGEEIWKELVENNPSLAKKFVKARIQSDREEVLVEFKNNLKKNNDESFWQVFFTENPWIFGYGLQYKFMTIETDQPNYGGEKVTGEGKQKGDFLLKSESEIKFTVLVEIKRPDTELLAKTKIKKQIRYRNGAWLLSRDLLGGVSQLQVNCKTWQRTSDYPENRELNENKILTIQPKGILVIGDNKQLSANIEHSTTFELFRRNLLNIEVITYDELYERAKFIVENKQEEKKNNSELESDDLPF